MELPDHKIAFTINTDTIFVQLVYTITDDDEDDDDDDDNDH